MQNIFLKMLKIYEMPGQSYWRTHELVKLLELKELIGFSNPVLEIGCGDGLFSSLVFDRIDDAIDINPKAIERARRLMQVYERLHIMDARKMQFEDSTYKTVFANCVLEHIPNVTNIIQNSHRVLKQGGIFITTVPLLEMNNFLLFKSTRYAALRKRQLSHENLLYKEQWMQMFTDAGFSQIMHFPYLFGNQCTLWDKMDFPACIGYSRYTIGNALRLLNRALPTYLINPMRLSIANSLTHQALYIENRVPCATAIVAIK